MDSDTRQNISVRAVKRIPEEHRRCENCVSWVTRAPWNKYKEDANADGGLPEGVPVEERSERKDESVKTINIETKSKAPRDFLHQKRRC